MQAIINNPSLHSVYVVDEEGISEIFTELKQALASQVDCHTTLIYFSPEKKFIFYPELEILQKRYPTQFLLYPVAEKVDEATATLQEFLEAVINSNTKHRLIFVVSGNEELTHIISNQLWFLGLSKNQIKIYRKDE
jgi:NAD(P)H-flavin reductase